MRHAARLDELAPSQRLSAAAGKTARPAQFRRFGELPGYGQGDIIVTVFGEAAVRNGEEKRAVGWLMIFSAVSRMACFVRR
jgi:hypothetical protein